MTYLIREVEDSHEYFDQYDFDYLLEGAAFITTSRSLCNLYYDDQTKEYMEKWDAFTWDGGPWIDGYDDGYTLIDFIHYCAAYETGKIFDIDTQKEVIDMLDQPQPDTYYDFYDFSVQYGPALENAAVDLIEWWIPGCNPSMIYHALIDYALDSDKEETCICAFLEGCSGRTYDYHPTHGYGRSEYGVTYYPSENISSNALLPVYDAWAFNTGTAWELIDSENGGLIAVEYVPDYNYLCWSPWESVVERYGLEDYEVQEIDWYSTEQNYRTVYTTRA